jgi:hypothetical protein
LIEFSVAAAGYQPGGAARAAHATFIQQRGFNRA